MIERLTIASTLFVLLTAGGMVEAAPKPMHIVGLGPVVWNSLQFRASSWMSKASIGVTLEPMLAAEAVSDFLPARDREVVSPPGAQIQYISSNIVVDSWFLPKNFTRLSVWFAPENAAALQRIYARSRTGLGDFVKRYRFTRKGVLRNRTRPETRREARLDWKAWTNVKEHFYSHPDSDCSRVTEPLVLLYVASVSPGLTDEEPMRLCAFHKKQLHRVTLIPDGKTRLQVDYVEKTGTAEVRRLENTQAVRVVLKVDSLDPSPDGVEKFSFLGLTGDIVFYLDQRSGLPLQVSGDLPMIGQTDFKLREASFAVP
jgi:hypothetical protein